MKHLIYALWLSMHSGLGFSKDIKSDKAGENP